MVGGISVKQDIKCKGSEEHIIVVDLKSGESLEYEVFMKPEPLKGLSLLVNHVSYIDVEKGMLYTIGGGSNCFSFGMHINSCVFQLHLKDLINVNS